MCNSTSLGALDVNTLEWGLKKGCHQKLSELINGVFLHMCNIVSISTILFIQHID